MTTVRITAAAAIVRWMIAQRTIDHDGNEVALFPGVYGIFGHGNVTSLGLALHEAGDDLPTWRGQNEQGMALAAVAFAKATRRRQVMAATSSIGPGALNMVTAAGVAHANRLPLLLLVGDTFATRAPDPVLQQAEHFHDPTITVNDAFRPVSRFWDRITRPEQLISSLPQAVSVLLDPATCGPAVLALPQDVQSMACDYPVELFRRRVHLPRRPRPDADQLRAAAEVLRRSKRPLIISGGGVRYSGAEAAVQAFAERHGIPVVETVAGKSALLAEHPLNCGPVGVVGCEAANTLVATADVVLAIGTRLQDFTTGSWTIFSNPKTTIVGINAAPFDAMKRGAVSVVGDAKVTVEELDGLTGEWRSAQTWTKNAAKQRKGYHAYIDGLAAPGPRNTFEGDRHLATYAQVVGVCDRLAEPQDYALTAAGGFPGELNNGWRAKSLHSFDCEYGFSCMGYELSGAWGAKMALPDREVFSFCGDGSYLMMNSDLYSSVLAGHKLIVILCDNGGYAVINRLQVNQGGEPFNNLLDDVRHAGPAAARVDFAAHAASMGCNAERVDSLDGLASAIGRARISDRTTVIVIDTDAYAWTEGGAFWEVGVPEVSDRPAVRAARQAVDEAKRAQRLA